MEGWMEVWIDGCMHEYYGCMGNMDMWIEGGMDGWMDGWMDGAGCRIGGVPEGRAVAVVEADLTTRTVQK